MEENDENNCDSPKSLDIGPEATVLGRGSRFELSLQSSVGRWRLSRASTWHTFAE
jgi:hypothetical protein